MAQAPVDTDRGTAHPTIKKGSRGDAVELAQQRLNMRFYDPGPIDGRFGPKTAKAVRWYQRDRDLDDDGMSARGPGRAWTRRRCAADPAATRSSCSSGC